MASSFHVFGVDVLGGPNLNLNLYLNLTLNLNLILALNLNLEYLNAGRTDILITWADYFQIVGARQILSPNYIQKSIEVFKKDPSILCVGGFVRNVYLSASFSRLNNQVAAWRAGKKVMVTIPNPNQKQTNKPFILFFGTK